jgi:hypothetical protein
MAETWRRLPAKTRLRRVDEQANSINWLEDTDMRSSTKWYPVNGILKHSVFAYPNTYQMTWEELLLLGHFGNYYAYPTMSKARFLA